MGCIVWKVQTSEGLVKVLCRHAAKAGPFTSLASLRFGRDDIVCRFPKQSTFSANLA